MRSGLSRTASSLRARWTRRRPRGWSPPRTTPSRSTISSSACASCAMRPGPSVLELWEPEGALGALEEWLGGLREGESADVYLGYRLGDELRREPWPSPAEPCPLPIVAARVRASNSLLQAPFRIGEWEATWAPEDYAAAVEEVRAAIARGDVYQVNLVQHLS